MSMKQALLKAVVAGKEITTLITPTELLFRRKLFVEDKHEEIESAKASEEQAQFEELSDSLEGIYEALLAEDQAPEFALPLEFAQLGGEIAGAGAGGGVGAGATGLGTAGAAGAVGAGAGVAAGVAAGTAAAAGGVTAGAVAGTVAVAGGVTAASNNDNKATPVIDEDNGDDDSGDFYISIGRLDATGTTFGAWFDSNENGVFDSGENTSTTQSPDGQSPDGKYYTLDGIDFAAGSYTVRFVDIVGNDYNPTLVSRDGGMGPLSITEFGEDDNFIIDMATNFIGWMGLGDDNIASGPTLKVDRPTWGRSGDQDDQPLGVMFQPLVNGETGTYGRLSWGGEPTDLFSAQDFSLLQVVAKEGGNSIGWDARVFVPNPSDPEGGSTFGGGGALVIFTGVPLSATNVEYIVPFFGG